MNQETEKPAVPTNQELSAYTLTFSVPARATVRVETRGQNQQDALANGYAALAGIKASSAEILSLDLDDAEFMDMERGALPKSSHPGPLPEYSEDLYQVVCYLGGHLFSASAPVARAVADEMATNLLKDDKCAFDEVAVREFGGPEVSRQRVTRGGWMVVVNRQPGESCSRPVEEELLAAWLSAEEGRDTFRTAVLSKRYARVQLIDFSKRLKGPRIAHSFSSRPTR